jgi:hypothetical protein
MTLEAILVAGARLWACVCGGWFVALVVVEAVEALVTKRRPRRGGEPCGR